MRFLIDNALSHVVAAELSNAGHDAIHVRDVGLQHAAAEAIMQLAAAEARVVVSADTDFGTLLALHEQRWPSIVLSVAARLVDRNSRLGYSLRICLPSRPT